MKNLSNKLLRLRSRIGITLLTIFLVGYLTPVDGNTPKFLERIPNVNVTAGRDVSLPCVVDNIGHYKVAWTHINRHLLLAIDTDTVTLIPRFRVTRDDIRTWTLHIRGVEPEDTGYYVCQVNMEPIINQVGYLQVVVPPTFVDDESSPSHVSVQEGADMELVCVAEGVPKPSITWNREDGRSLSGNRGNLFAGEVLTLKSVTRQDMGAYLCIASNKVPPSISKRIVLDIHFAPVISVPNQLVGAPLGTSVTLECHVSAFPNAVHYWEFKGNLLINSSRQETREMRNGYKTTLKLSLHKLRNQDFGTYVCGSKNSLGETESNLKLYEITVRVPDERTNKIKGDKTFKGDARGRMGTLSPWNKAEFDVGATSYTLHDVSLNEFSTNDFDFLGQQSHSRKTGSSGSITGGGTSSSSSSSSSSTGSSSSSSTFTSCITRNCFYFLFSSAPAGYSILMNRASILVCQILDLGFMILYMFGRVTLNALIMFVFGPQ